MQINQDFFRFDNRDGYLSAILDQAPVGILTFSEEWSINFVNDSFIKFGILYNFEYTSLPGLNLREKQIFPGNDISTELESLGEGYAFEKELKDVKTLEGNSITLLVKGSPLFKEGKFSGGILVVEDIKVLASAKQETELKYFLEDKIVNQFADAVIITDLDGNIVHFTLRSVNTLGESPDQLTRKSIFDLFEKEEAINLLEKTSSVIKRKSVEHLIVKRSVEIEEQYFRCDISIHSTGYGRTELIFYIFNNITEDLIEKNKHDAELNNLLKLKTLFESSTDAFIEVDINGNIKNWSLQAEKFFGSSLTESKGSFAGSSLNLFDEKFFTKIKNDLAEKRSRAIEINYESKSSREVLELKFVSIPGSDSVFILIKIITERANQEKELKLSEEKFRSMIAQSEELICNLDLEGKIQYVNPAFTAALKYSREELIGKELLSLALPSYLEKSNFNFRSVLEKRVSTVELPFVTRTGKIVYLMASFSPIFDDARKLKSYNCFLIDLTDKKTSEKDLRIFRSLFEAAQDGIAVCLEGKLVLCNHNFADIFGYAKGEDLNGKDLLDLVSNNDVLKVAEYLQWIEQKKDLPGRFEFLGRRKDGIGIFTEMSVSSFESDAKLYIVMVVRDVTERKRAQQAIRDSEEKYRNITENIDDFLYTFERTDGKLRSVFYTSSVEKITGYSQADFLSDSRLFLQIVYPDDFSFVKKRIKNLLKSRIQLSEEFEFRIINQHGNIVWVRNKMNLVRNAQGEIQKIYGLVSDITLRKKAEEELKASTNDLVKLNETKDRFISIVSHDLRTPFSSILGFTDLLLSDEELTEKEKTQYIEFIRESSKSMLALVNSLLDWTRLQTGNVRFEPERVDALSMIENCHKMLSGAAFQKNIELATEVGSDIYVFVDKSLVNQVFNNLVSNAIKFTPRGGKIVISSKRSADGRFIEFSIKDNGLGIKPENIKKLFGVDVKFTSEGTEGEKGSGLGLSLVQEIIQKHGGKIHVESEFGKGSDFIFTLPVASAHILLVDDSKTDRLLYSKILKNITPDYNVEVASNGKEALEKITQSPPALVITDHLMPVMNGYELLISIKKSDIKGKPPIIILSSELDRQAIYDYNQLGVEYVFQKPVNLSNFKQAVEKSLKKGMITSS